MLPINVGYFFGGRSNVIGISMRRISAKNFSHEEINDCKRKNLTVGLFQSGSQKRTVLENLSFNFLKMN